MSIRPPRTAVFAGRDDLRDVRVARRYELAPQFLGRKARALPEVERSGGEILHRRETVERRRDGNDRHVERLLHELIERCQALRHEIVVRRELVVGQRLPVRKQVNPRVRIEEGQFLQQTLGIRCSGGKDREGPAGRAHETGDGEGVGGTVQGRRTYTVPRRGHLRRDHCKRALLYRRLREEKA
jgi:hypothetical protein